ncbi:mechanosensitive ion channel family protein [Pontibacter chinhatensis]|uniref:Small-conductance mechanosensitive channel n=1 Tax=Pontibacter chinhatensis TaxID=1436961 RepID=A0A1I2MNU6_9BACT|nr:mechanosensitive ion channel family protein [Pontibacter chinhatensis]SFF91056.1 Small-conductance mechanosensitive channel [Pontibacter chinhatensis]
MTDFLQQVYFHNTVQSYLIVVAIVLISFTFIGFFRKRVLTRAAKLTARTKSNLDSHLVESIDRFGVPALYIFALYSALNYLLLPPKLDRVLQVALIVACTFLAIRIVSTTLILLLRSYIGKQEHGEEKVKQLGGVILVLNVTIWGLGLLTLLDNLGYNVTTIVAGLGIGGIAVALAAQNILGDLFNYFVIFFDRPFEVGDFIVLDDKSGVVDKIGVKTTRIKSLSGEQLVVANSDLTNSRIHNYKQMQQRRVVFKLGVVYQATYEQLELIPGLLRQIVEEQDMVRFDRAHFTSYGDSSLDFEVVYYVLSSNYNDYMDIQQRINLRIFKEFQELNIDFAYPTRTLFVVNEHQEKQVQPVA